MRLFGWKPWQGSTAWLVVGAAVLLAAASVFWLAPRLAEGRRIRGLEFSDPKPAPDFALRDQNGAVFRLSEQKGRVVVVYFGYTACPDACPTTLLYLRRVREALGRDAERLAVAFVSVDPERDTPDALGSYVATQGHPSFRGLTGAREELAEVWRLYGIHVEKEPASGSSAGYWVSHTALSYVVDTRGRLRVAHPFGTDDAVILHDIKVLLAEKG